jgi:hypothetical protein
LKGKNSEFLLAATNLANGTVRSKRIDTSLPPLSVKLYTCLSVSPPPFPRRTSVYSSTGVSMGTKPKDAKAFSRRENICFLVISWLGRESLNPLRILGSIISLIKIYSLKVAVFCFYVAFYTFLWIVSAIPAYMTKYYHNETGSSSIAPPFSIFDKIKTSH